MCVKCCGDGELLHGRKEDSCGSSVASRCRDIINETSPWYADKREKRRSFYVKTTI